RERERSMSFTPPRSPKRFTCSMHFGRNRARRQNAISFLPRCGSVDCCRGRRMKESRFDNVWDAIESSPAEAAGMKARSELMMAIRRVVDGWKMTQAQAARRLGVTQPRLNDL